jgi:polysaccharide chain length determinant protein (PEP-CTERM system associated)
MKHSEPSEGTHNSLSTTPLSIFRMIWKRKWLLLGVWAILSTSVVLAVRHLRPTYRAEAVVLVDSQKISERYVSSIVNTEVQERLAAISQRILSFSHLQRIIDDFRLYRRERQSISVEELIEKMRKDITIKLERSWTGTRPGAFRIGFSGEDPNAVSQVVNRLGFLFVSENVHAREVQAVGTEEFIVAQLAEAKRTLDQLEAKVSHYKLSHSGELPEQQQSIISTLAQLRSSLDASRDNLNRVQDAKITLENNLNMTEITRQTLEKSLAERTQAQPTPPLRQRPESEILQERYTNMLRRYSVDHPDTQALRRAIDAAINEERSGAQQAIAVPSPVRKQATAAESDALQLEQTHERVRTLKVQISQAEKELAGRKAEQDGILKEISSYQERLGRLPLREQEMAQLLRDYENSKNNYRILLDKKLAAEMATEMELRQKSERFTILDPAHAPTKPISPNRPLLYTGGCVLSLAVSVALTLLLESRKAVFLGEWELPEGVVVLGRLPVVETSPVLEGDSQKLRFWRRLRAQTWATSTQTLP